MIKRTIIISTPSKITIKNNQLVCSNMDVDTDSKSAPIEDLGIVIVENQRAILTVPVINALADNNVSLIFCDAHCLPTSFLSSMSPNATQSEMLRFQVSATAATNNRAWKQIVEAKIKNQSLLLSKLGKDGLVLKPYYSNVKTGDSDNREGISAKIYWKSLFGKEFVRDRYGCPPNNLLNYGYSILRSAVARTLMGSGLNPSFGIFHKNRYNPMPLADDIMEPYRPFVDEIVFGLYENGETELTCEAKSYLIGCLNCDTLFDTDRKPLQLGLTMTSASLGRYYKGEAKTLILPRLEL